MAKYDQAFLEAVSWYAGTDDTESHEYKEAMSILEGKNSERQEYLDSMISDIGKWSNSAKSRNQEIYDSKGDITKIEPNLMEVCKALEGNGMTTAGPGYENMYDINKNGDPVSFKIQKTRGLYTHFNLHKKVYTDAFKTNNKTVTTVYVAGVWLIISYLAACCVFAMKPSRPNNPDMKFGPMINDLIKIISHPKYIEYMETVEKATYHNESLLYESVLAIGSTIVAMIVSLRLIVWNIYTMRTKLSDKLKVTAEFLEKNANRLSNTDKKNKDKIVKKQRSASEFLNKIANKVAIKMDDDQPSKPAPAKKPSSSPSKPSTNEDDDDMDIEL